MSTESVEVARQRALSFQYVSMILVILACALSSMKPLSDSSTAPKKSHSYLTKTNYRRVDIRSDLTKPKEREISSILLNLDSSEDIREKRKLVQSLLVSHDLSMQLRIGIGRAGKRAGLSRFTNVRFEKSARLLEWLSAHGVPAKVITVRWTPRRQGFAEIGIFRAKEK